MIGSPLSRRLTGLGALIAGITLAIFLADVALRVIPLERFAFRGWEPMAVRPGPDATFTANRRYENDRAYGDLAAVSNRPAMREFRREVFTTDANGFRNPPGTLAAGPPDIIVFGDSFAVEAPSAMTRRCRPNSAGSLAGASTTRQVVA